MKHRKLQDLMSDKNLTPEDVAQFILFETDLNDNDKFRVICDLIVCCEKSASIKLEKQNAVYREALEKIQEYQMNYVEVARATKVYQIAEQALRHKCTHDNSVWNSHVTLYCRDCGITYRDEPKP